MTLNLTMADQPDLKPRITVFGVGGAGGNAVTVDSVAVLPADSLVN